jgi:hypothetical protein
MVCLPGEVAGRVQHVAGRGASVVRSLADTRDVRRYLLRAYRRLLPVAGDFPRRGSLLLHRRGDGGDDYTDLPMTVVMPVIDCTTSFVATWLSRCSENAPRATVPHNNSVNAPMILLRMLTRSRALDTDRLSLKRGRIRQAAAGAEHSRRSSKISLSGLAPTGF